ncbi:MAG: hypothetical protein JXB85_15765 [Anaerolineales bacterium]|nr:hypothetical protein [Anaerolineales bacterium]
MKRPFTWNQFVKIICATSAGLLIAAIGIKLAAGELLAEVSLETLLIALGISILIPYISHLEAFGVKVEVRKQVDDLSARIQAMPDYILGSEYHFEGDLLIAERSYRKSLEQCPDFWPALLGIAGIYDDQEQYVRAITEYRRVLEIDKDNLYALNNLANLYMIAPQPIKNPRKALEMADRALTILPTLGSALHYKAIALIDLGQHQEALTILKGVVDQGLMAEEERHWTMVEIMVANSNLGVRVSNETLEKIFLRACEHAAGKRMLLALLNEEEQERFAVADRPVIKHFLKKKRKYLDETI